MSKNLDFVQISEKRYTENGALFWSGNISQASLVVHNFFMFNKMADLFDFFEESKGILITFKNVSDSEIFCSAFTFLYDKKEKTTIKWGPICCSLLFPKNVGLSNTLFLFLQKNLDWEGLSVKREALSCLMNHGFIPLKTNHLTNFLNFLKVKEKSKNKIIENCFKVNNYEPLTQFLIDSVKNLKNDEFEKAPLLEEKNFPLVTNSVIEKLPFSEEKNFSLTATRSNYFMYFSLLLLFGLTFLKKFYNPPRHVLPPVIPSSCQNIFYGGTFELSDNFSESGFLNGGGLNNVPNPELPACNIEGCSGSLIVSQVGPNGMEQVIASGESVVASEEKKEVTSIEASLTKQQVAEVFQTVLEKPKFYYIDKNGKVRNLDYKVTAAGPLKVNFDVEGGFLTPAGSEAVYKELDDHLETFAQRYAHVHAHLKKNNCVHDFKIRSTMMTAKGEVVNIVLEGDHCEQARALESTGRNKETSFVVLKPKHIHKYLTQFRKISEYIRTFYSAQNYENELQKAINKAHADNIAPVTAQERAQRQNVGYEVALRNKTNYVNNDDVDIYFNEMLKETIRAYQMIPDADFPSELSRDTLIEAERTAINSQKKQFVAECEANGMTKSEMLVKLDSSFAADANLRDIQRATNLITSAREFCSKSDNQFVLNTQNITNLVTRVFGQSEKTRQLLFSFKRFFPGSPGQYHALTLLLDSQLSQQTLEIQGLFHVVQQCGIMDFQAVRPCYQDYLSTPAELWSEEVNVFDALVTTSTLPTIDELILELHAQIIVNNNRVGMHKLPKKTSTLVTAVDTTSNASIQSYDSSSNSSISSGSSVSSVTPRAITDVSSINGIKGSKVDPDRVKLGVQIGDLYI